MSTPFSEINLSQFVKKSDIGQYAFKQSDTTETITNVLAGNPSDSTFGTNRELEDYAVSVQPTSTSQNVHIIMVINGEWAGQSHNTGLCIRKNVDGVDTYIRAAAAGNRLRIKSNFINAYIPDVLTTLDQAMVQYTDTPNTTSVITYTPVLITESQQNFNVNRTTNDADNLGHERAWSSVTAEVKGL